jgi:hypothetical protein
MNDNVIYLNRYGKRSDLRALYNEVLEKSIHPQDYYEIAAILESMGWNDLRAAEMFGAEDVFELAAMIWDMIRDNLQIETYEEEEKVPLGKKIRTTIQSFIRGLLFALPMAISIVAMLTLRLSLWSYQYLSVELATSIAIGTILSFMTVGGFTQAIARRGFFYLSQGFYNMAKRITFFLVRIGYVTSFVMGAFYLIFNLYYKNFPWYMLFVTVLYYVFLCSNWLSVTIMYMLKKEFTFAGLITVGILLTAAMFYILKLNIILAQVIALLFISIVGFILVVSAFRRAELKEEAGISPPMPKRSIMLYTLKPYFIYGFLYFTFIFFDRIMAWSTNNALNMPYIIWFRGDYELGLDFALLMMILPMGLCEITVTSLMAKFESIQKNALGNDLATITGKYLKLYFRNLILVAAGAVLSALMIVLLVQITQHSSLAKIYSFSYVTDYVFYCGLVGYAIICVALSNVLILFSLSQPEMVIKSMTIALLLNFIVGFCFSRWIDYYFAIYGLIFGAIVFLVLSTRYVIRVISNIDYYTYAAL